MALKPFKLFFSAPGGQHAFIHFEAIRLQPFEMNN